MNGPASVGEVGFFDVHPPKSVNKTSTAAHVAFVRNPIPNFITSHSIAQAIKLDHQLQRENVIFRSSRSGEDYFTSLLYHKQIEIEPVYLLSANC